MKNSTDAHLVTAAQAGEKAAFVDLVARYQGMVTGITLSILRDFQASEDAAQETFITAWKKMSEIHHPEKLRPWLAQIARNAALMALRKTRPLPPLETFPGASEIPRPDELIVQKEEAQIVLNALAELPEKLRPPHRRDHLKNLPRRHRPHPRPLPPRRLFPSPKSQLPHPR